MFPSYFILCYFSLFTVQFLHQLQAYYSLTPILSCTSRRPVLLPAGLSPSDSKSWLNLITAAHPAASHSSSTLSHSFSHHLSFSISPPVPSLSHLNVYVCVCVLPPPCSLPSFLAFLQVRLLYCSQEEAELVFKAAWSAGQAGASHMWFAVGPALSGLGMENLPQALFAVRPQGWRDEPRRRIARGVSVLTHGAVAMRKDYGTTGGPNFVTNCMTDANQTQRLRGRMR